jgi:hypothetical protein
MLKVGYIGKVSAVIKPLTLDPYSVLRRSVRQLAGVGKPRVRV